LARTNIINTIGKLNKMLEELQLKVFIDGKPELFVRKLGLKVGCN
jgi:hypothetical protein